MNGQLTNEQALLQVFVQIVVAVASPLLLALLGMLLRGAYKRVMVALSDDQLAYATKMVRRLVLAAEQYGLAELASKIGVEKKAWVIDQLTDVLDRRGIYLDLTTISALIEAAVLEEFGPKPVEAQTDVAKLN